jgi:hypothetical protein
MALLVLLLLSLAPLTFLAVGAPTYSHTRQQQRGKHTQQVSRIALEGCWVYTAAAAPGPAAARRLLLLLAGTSVCYLELLLLLLLLL